MNSLWLGSQASLNNVMEARQLAIQHLSSNSEQPKTNILSVQNGVGIITIKGDLVDGNAGYMSYYGVTGYGDVREALIAALSDQSVGAILLNINSGGGAVAGVHELAQLIAQVDSIKPVVSFASGAEASAALWVGSSARYSFTSATAITGSLGVVTVHTERSKQMAMDGMTATVIRAGSEKALATGAEPLTEKARAGLQDRVDALAAIFLDHVAKRRGMNSKVADAAFGQGREFVGKQAVDVGLMDAVGSIEDAFTKAIALCNTKKPTGRAAASTSNSGNSAALTVNNDKVSSGGAATASAAGDNLATLEGNNMTDKLLTQEQMVALAAGLSPEPAPTDKPAEGATAPVAALDIANAFQATIVGLQAELATATTSAAAAAAANVAEVTALQATVASLATIVRNSCKSMSMPLGAKVDTLDTMAATDLVAEFERTSTLFKAKFKVGGLAATNAVEDKPEAAQAAKVNPMFLLAAQSLKTN